MGPSLGLIWILGGPAPSATVESTTENAPAAGDVAPGRASTRSDARRADARGAGRERRVRRRGSRAPSVAPTIEDSGLRLGVGLTLTTLGAALWAGGAVGIDRGLERRAWCEANAIELPDGMLEPPVGCLIDAPAMAFASGAMSLVFAIPATIVGIIVTERAARDVKTLRGRRAARRSTRWTAAAGGLVMRF